MIHRSMMFAIVALLATVPTLASTTAEAVQRRMSDDAAAGKALVAHVIVALCDNRYQGIVPVPAHLGDGDDAASNLYWGAMYGVKTYFSKHENWTRLPIDSAVEAPVLDIVAYRSRIARNGESVDAYIIAEAWQGRRIEASTRRFLELSGGQAKEVYRVGSEDNRVLIEAGSAAHVVAYVGHNGLMDFSSPDISLPDEDASPRSSVVLACRSRAYFSSLPSMRATHSLLATNGLMAPEAYTLEAAITAWFSGESPAATRDLAADTYADFQNANRNWARRLFSTEN